MDMLEKPRDGFEQHTKPCYALGRRLLPIMAARWVVNGSTPSPSPWPGRMTRRCIEGGYAGNGVRARAAGDPGATTLDQLPSWQRWGTRRRS
jgi:hypothetical protein